MDMPLVNIRCPRNSVNSQTQLLKAVIGKKLEKPKYFSNQCQLMCVNQASIAD
jgi:hypothetical protein